MCHCSVWILRWRLWRRRLNVALIKLRHIYVEWSWIISKNDCVCVWKVVQAIYPMCYLINNPILCNLLFCKTITFERLKSMFFFFNFNLALILRYPLFSSTVAYCITRLNRNNRKSRCPIVNYKSCDYISKRNYNL